MKIHFHNSLSRAVRRWKKVGEGSAEMSIETIEYVMKYTSHLL